MNWGRTEAQQRWFDEAERQEEERDHAHGSNTRSSNCVLRYSEKSQPCVRK